MLIDLVERYSAECSFGILYVCTPTEICRKRNEDRAQSDRVPDAAFQRMENAFEPPDREKCAFEASLVTFESDAASLEDCIETLLVNAERLKQAHSEKTQENARKEQMRVSARALPVTRTQLMESYACAVEVGPRPHT